MSFPEFSLSQRREQIARGTSLLRALSYLWDPAIRLRGFKVPSTRHSSGTKTSVPLRSPLSDRWLPRCHYPEVRSAKEVCPLEFLLS